MARRRGYYTEGSTARQIEYDYAEPARRERRVTRERNRSAEVPRIHSGAARQAEKRKKEDKRLASSVSIAVVNKARERAKAQDEKDSKELERLYGEAQSICREKGIRNSTENKALRNVR